MERIERTPLLDAGEWFAEAVRLDAECRELRRMLTAVVIWIAETNELLEIARTAIAARWDGDERA